MWEGEHRYQKEYWREGSKDSLHEFQAKRSRHLRHTNQPVRLVGINQLAEVLQINI